MLHANGFTTEQNKARIAHKIASNALQEVLSAMRIAKENADAWPEGHKRREMHMRTFDTLFSKLQSTEQAEKLAYVEYQRTLRTHTCEYRPQFWTPSYL